MYGYNVMPKDNVLTAPVNTIYWVEIKGVDATFTLVHEAVHRAYNVRDPI